MQSCVFHTVGKGGQVPVLHGGCVRTRLELPAASSPVSAWPCLPLAGVHTTAARALVPFCPQLCLCCEVSPPTGCWARDSFGLETAVLSMCLKRGLQPVLSLGVQVVPAPKKLTFVGVSTVAAPH